MTLPVVPGSSMSFSQINTELGLTSTALISLNDTAVRTLAGVGASPATIAITNLSGKANQFSFTISSNQTNANLRTLAVNAGWNQASKVVATINSGIYISSNGTGTPALTVDGSFPGGVGLINSGTIAGMGGNGGVGTKSVSHDGLAGGLALSVASAITITNNGTIAGGGGGAGAGQTAAYCAGGDCGMQYAGGGGGGGGRSSNAANSSGGAGGYNTTTTAYAGNGGAGTVSAPGGGGSGTNASGGGGIFSGNGGTGGGWGAAGNNGSAVVPSPPYSFGPIGYGAAAGGAVSGNSNVTWAVTGTRLGSLA